MTTYAGTNLVGPTPGIYVGSSPVDKLYAGTNLVWQRADTTAPTQPPSFSASTSGTTASLSWGAATDNVAVTGYRVYRGPTLLTTTTARSYTDSGLAYSTSYAWSVSAVDAAGNESSRATASATTGASPVSYPYTATTFPVPNSQGNGTYTVGTYYLDPARQYTLSWYGYCASAYSYPSTDYDNSACTATYRTSNGTASGPTLTVGTSTAAYAYTTGSFFGGGNVTFTLQISNSYNGNTGLAGNPGLTITVVG